MPKMPRLESRGSTCIIKAQHSRTTLVILTAYGAPVVALVIKTVGSRGSQAGIVITPATATNCK